ncbi:S-adenosyl-L-methionine-dependent methyltransferase [Leptodontidium sp. 2 PMI_412]|nr:S-adenosyl-L-methionine-dependent methyltransferase [Leptodontidium sp. 2 PMI_412]
MPSLPNDSAVFVGLSEEEQAVQQTETSTDADSDVGMSDAGYETDSIGTASTSLASSARAYALENGRRYHKFREGSYHFPNDDSEQDKEDMTHAMMVNLCQRLHFAPIGMNPQNILDMGTGTGIWAIDMGDQYSSANILGVDLSPIQPTWVPPNVRFMVDDIESPWLHPRNHFDYIHSRHTVMAIRDWLKLMRRALSREDGWRCKKSTTTPIATMLPNDPVAQYWGLVRDGLASLGVDFDATLLLADMMRDAGFINVTTRIFHIPIGRWPKNKVLKMVGLSWRAILLDGAQPIALGPLTRGLKWSREAVEMLLVEVREAYMDEWVHSYMPLHIIYGQKPEEGIGMGTEMAGVM